MNEFELIRRFLLRPSDDPAIVVGNGDDAAVVRVDGALAVAVDTLVAGVHFPADCPADAIGHRALAVNLSDIAAIAGQPRWCTLALTLPAADAGWVEPFANGLFALAERFGVALIGGDVTGGPLTVSVQILGTIDMPVTRAGGVDGDDVYVTGTLGDAAAGLERRQAGGAAPDDALVQRFLYPEPRVAAGRALAGLAHAAIDVSDGLVADIGHIAAQSRCGAEIDIAALPLSDALVAAVGGSRARELALAGGDDYELCFTAPPDAAGAVAGAFERLALRVTRIGRLTATGRVDCRLGGRSVDVGTGGYAHF